jgi:quercetin dioxygenase-like cupin family protein
MTTHASTHPCPAGTQAARIHELEPDERLRADRLDPARDQLICVEDGIVYVALEDDEHVLTFGDSVVIGAGEQRRVWNAGDETARFVVAERIGRRAELATAA